MSRKPASIEPSCMYPREDELARVLLGDRARQWPEVAQVEENEGLPRIDPLYGGRYWPAVQAFYARRFKLLDQQSQPVQHHGDRLPGENFDGIRRARRTRSATA